MRGLRLLTLLALVLAATGCAGDADDEGAAAADAAEAEALGGAAPPIFVWMPGRKARFSTVLRACIAHCRVLAAEVYLATGNVLASTPRADACTGKRADAFCGTSAQPGSLRAQIATLRRKGAGITRKEPGLGGYAPYHATWGQATEAECLKTRIAAYAWPRSG